MNDMYQVLLDRLASSDSGAESGPTVQDLLAQMGEVDPRMNVITKILARRQMEAQEKAPSFEEDEDGVIDGEAVESSQQSIERRQWSERLRRMATAMYGELEQLRERNDTLAAALGACYLCWGDDVLCEVCHGRGRPGALFPDPELFAQYVAPAMRQAQRQPRNEHRLPRNTDPAALNGASNPAERRGE